MAKCKSLTGSAGGRVKSRCVAVLRLLYKYGSYFGATLCAVDVNNDGFDDLLVGAPFYNHGLGDEGSVSLFLNLRNVRSVVTCPPTAHLLWPVHAADATRLDSFFLVSSCVHTADKTVLSRLDPVSMSPRWRCEHNWRRDKTVLSCRVGGLNTTADKTRQFCLVGVRGVNN